LLFRNLIDNAVKYGDDHDPRVHVSLKCENNRVVAEVSDNGRGIPLKLRRKIFGRFVRLGSELEREKPGTGLGLYIVRTLVSRLGGRIKLHDQGYYKGTTFQVDLPGRPIAGSMPAEEPAS